MRLITFILAIVTAGALLFCCGCGGEKQQSPDGTKLGSGRVAEEADPEGLDLDTGDDTMKSAADELDRENDEEPLIDDESEESAEDDPILDDDDAELEVEDDQEPEEAAKDDPSLKKDDEAEKEPQ